MSTDLAVAQKPAETTTCMAVDFRPLPDALDAHWRDVMRGRDKPLLSDAERVQAERELSALEPLLMRADPRRDAYPWLRQLGRGSSLSGAPHHGMAGTTEAEKAQRAEVLQAALEVLWEVCRELPRGVWCDESRVAYLRSWLWWPLPARLYAHLEPYANALRYRKHMLTSLLEVRPRPSAAAEEPTIELSDADRALIRTNWRAFLAQNARFDPDHAQANIPRTRTKPISPDVLEAALEAEISRAPSPAQAAALSARLALLRRQRGNEASVEGRLSRPAPMAAPCAA
jgi:hypothetical protein